jgi:Fur family ferric uptake transcriptional regulator
MTHNQLHWEYVLQRSGRRVTRQRTIILDAICDNGGHRAFDDIYRAVRDRDRSIDRSTVYRALHLFVELDLVVEAKTGGAETLYEMSQLRPHHHLVCRTCGNEQEISNASMRAMVVEILNEYRFKVASDHLVFFGICETCDEGETSALE